MKLTFETKVRILGQFYTEFKDDKELENFFEYNDVGLPLAYFIFLDLAKETKLGEEAVQETFILLLDTLKLDEKVLENSFNLADLMDLVEPDDSSTIQVLRILESPSLSKMQAIEFLDKHEECFGPELDLCDMCEGIVDKVDVLRLLARNPALDRSVQMRVLDESIKWQDREVGVMLDFAGNPNISDDVKKYIFGEEAELENYDGSEELIEELAELAEDNPRISKEEIETFLSIYSDEE